MELHEPEAEEQHISSIMKTVLLLSMQFAQNYMEGPFNPFHIRSCISEECSVKQKSKSKLNEENLGKMWLE